MYATLTKSFSTKEFAGLGIFDCTCNYFRSRSTATVNKYCQWILNLWQIRVLYKLTTVVINNRNDWSFRNELLSNGNTVIKNAAGITTQVKDGCLHTFLFQFFVGFIKIHTGFFVEHYYANITNLGIGQHLRPNRFSFNFLADNADSFFLAVFIKKFQGNFAVNFTTNLRSYFFHVHIFGRLAINFDNFIAAFNASQSTRIIRQRRDYYIIIVAFTKNNTNTTKATNGCFA